MRTLLLVLLLASPCVAQIVPGRYVVELDSLPMGTLARTRSLSSEAVTRRDQIRTEQSRMRALIENRNGRVLSSLQNAMNGFVVNIPDADAATLSAIPGVKRVFPVTMSYVNLDHALPLHHIPQAWARIGGMSKAGLGIKIAVLDTGISPKHPAFQDASLTPPPGFPIFSSTANKAVVNNKIIVARDYGALYELKEPDSAVDRYGHGTNTADCAAGESAAGPYGTVTGAAPKAFLGIYKIAPLNTGGADSAVIAQAFDDALGDGMDVINLSFGSTVELFSSLQDYVIDRVTKLGVIVVTSAGNSGSSPATVGDGADDASAISVGASENDRLLGGSVALTGLPVILAAAGVYQNPNAPIAAALNDVDAWAGPAAGTSSGCVALPAGSLTGQIALAQVVGSFYSGSCLIDKILGNFAKAGALGAILYSATRNAAAPGDFDPLTATLPAIVVSNKDGLALKAAAAAGGLPVASIRFEGVTVPNESRALASFSSRGPTRLVSGLKPDLVATGDFVYMAAQSLDPTGGIYSSSGYVQESGTSYSSPIVAGAAAVLKGARPGLTMDQYRSLLINSASPLMRADGSVEPVQHSGAGIMNLDAAVASTIAVYPTSLTEGLGGSTLNTFDYLTLMNVSDTAETFTVSAVPFDSAPAPMFTTDSTNIFGIAPGNKTLSVTIGPRQSKTVDFTWAGTQLNPGEYQGIILVHGASGSTAAVPYWYGYPDFVPRVLWFLGAPTQATVGSQVNLYFRVTDSIGTGILDPTILNTRASVTTGNGSIRGPFASADFVDYFYFIATLSTAPGPNSFQVRVVNVPVNVNINGVRAGAGGQETTDAVNPWKPLQIPIE